MRLPTVAWFPTLVIMNSRGAIFLTMLFALSVPAVAEEAMREWTSADGKKIAGAIFQLEGDKITLDTDRGRFELPLSRLSEADRAFAKNWAAEKEKPGESEPGMAPSLGNFEDLKLGVWPQYVVSELAVEQIEEVEKTSESEDPYVYRTPHFEFRSPDRLSTSVVREFARIFEATFNFVDQMPIGLAPKPNASGHYITKLYMSKDEYYSDGGMEGSGGMFSWSRRGDEMDGVIKVPLTNLGVEYTGTRFIVDHKKRSTTLTNEIAHQVMMRWLATPMPTWLSEGIAEVVSSQDYDNGRFKLSSMNAAIVDEVTRGQGRDFQMVRLEKLMNITHAEWAGELAAGEGGKNYNSANVIAYYFLRLDGEGDGKHLVEFIKTLIGGRRGDLENLTAAHAEHLLRGRTYEALEKEVADAWRGQGLKIEF